MYELDPTESRKPTVAPPPPCRSKRPRICPECGYILEGSIAGGSRRCPECGTEFEAFRLPRQRAPGQWSEWRGLGRAAISLLLRSLVCLPVWAALVWLVIPIFSRAPGAISIMAVASMILAIPGVAIGHVLSKGLTERAGMTSLLITGMAGIVALTVVIGGLRIAQLSHPISGWHEHTLWMATSLIAIAWIVRQTIFDAE